MKKIYKLTLGAGAVATAAIPAIAVVSCGTKTPKKQESNSNTESKGTTGTHASTLVTHELSHVALSAAQIDKEFAVAKSDLLKRFIELKIADTSTTDADFDKNFGDYAVKLLKVIATDESALSTTDTTNLINVIISKYSKDISAGILPEIVKQVPVIAKYISDNHLLKGALDALGFDKDSEDSDLLEKLDSNNLNLVKAALFVAKAIQSIPKDLTADTAESVITMIQTLGLPGMIKDLFPNTQEAMAAWAAFLNSGIIQQVGQLIEAIFNKGIGNIDFDEVKKDLEALIDNAIKTLKDSGASIASMPIEFIKDLVNKLHIPDLIDILKGIATEGVFGIDTKITEETKAILDSKILSLLGQLLPMGQYTSMFNTFTGIINTVVNPSGGVASLSEAHFDATLKTIMGLIPGASLSDNIKGLITKVLYHGWATQEEFDTFVKSMVPDSVMSMSVDVLGSKLDVGKTLMNMLDAMYTGKELALTDPILALAKGAGIDASVSYDIASGFSPLLQKGLFALSKDDFDRLFLAIHKFVGQVSGILNHPMVAPKLPDSAKPVLDSIVRPVLSIISSIKPEVMTATASGVYNLLNHGIASAAADFRLALPQIFNLVKTSSINVPSYIEPIIFAAVNGLDSLTVSQGQALVDWLMTFIPKDMPVVSSNNFRDALYVALLGQEKLLDANKAKAEKIKLSAQSRVAIAAENAKIDDFVSQGLTGSVSVETLAKPSDKVLLSEIIVPQAPEGISVVVKSTRFSGSDVFVTYSVSSSVDGTKTAEYTAQLSGFQATQKLTVETFLTELKARFSAASITGVISFNNKNAAKDIFVAYLKELGVANADTMRDVIDTPSFKSIILTTISKGLITSDQIFVADSFNAWLRTRVAAKEATSTAVTKAFVDAMDAL